MRTHFKTEAAEVAALLKAELKEKFPEVKFSVRSETYSGGDSVNISYEATLTTPRIKEVEALTHKYEEGYFDGMTDSYVYTNKTKGPTAKYIFVRAETRTLQEKVKSEFLKFYSLTAEEFENQALVMQRWNRWPDQLFYRFMTEHYI